MNQQYDLQGFKDKLAKLRAVQIEATCNINACEELLVSQSTQANVDAFNKYKGFLSVARSALYKQSLIGLAIMYVPHKDSFSIPKLINHIENNQIEMMKEVSDGINFKPRVFTTKEMNYLKQQLTKVGAAISKLKNFRDKHLAHLDLEPVSDDDHLSSKEVNNLLKLSEDLLNRVSTQLLGQAVYYDLLKEEVCEDTKSLVKLIALSTRTAKLNSRR